MLFQKAMWCNSCTVCRNNFLHSPCRHVRTMFARDGQQCGTVFLVQSLQWIPKVNLLVSLRLYHLTYCLIAIALKLHEQKVDPTLMTRIKLLFHPLTYFYICLFGLWWFSSLCFRQMVYLSCCYFWLIWSICNEVSFWKRLKDVFVQQTAALYSLI